MRLSTEAPLPKSLLKLRKRRRHFFTKEEDLYIVKHSYFDLSFIEIAMKLNRTPVSIYTHLKLVFGTPICQRHNMFHKTCIECKHAREIWVIESLKAIESKKYQEIGIDEDEIIEFDYKEWTKKDKIRRLKKRTLFFKNVLPLQMYNDILNFNVEANLLKGRNLNSVFEQCIQIFIDDYLRNCILKENSVPNHILELYFGIEKNMKILRVIYNPYKKLVNQKYYPIGDFNFFFKDMMNLRKIYSKEVCDKIRPHLLNFYKGLSKLGIKDGNLAAIMYTTSRESGKIFTQSKLSEIFKISKGTLRIRIKEIKKLMTNQVFRLNIINISEIIKDSKTIEQ